MPHRVASCLIDSKYVSLDGASWDRWVWRSELVWGSKPNTKLLIRSVGGRHGGTDWPTHPTTLLS